MKTHSYEDIQQICAKLVCVWNPLQQEGCCKSVEYGGCKRYGHKVCNEEKLGALPKMEQKDWKCCNLATDGYAYAFPNLECQTV